ncbi:uncharacterized protein GGS22DRAFT_174077 [Annulohypoxylon maeteangense]|uniref:uncharacterized protein n=1 Tax=Annulohypoxylon maeteangense TaxID=1927788 RepID=UPI0020076911|nr:uncharacterized protein GGS22DRAFT_174077 [Annulohypoxylon maeteangense]KAI0880734.1 hypothetical protein GGS22DRAFT_174077 [Annulohypoxylon maeteangense]
MFHNSVWLSLLALSTLTNASVLNRDPTPTTTTAPGTSSTTCENPNQTTGYPDYNAFCQCPPYTADSPAYGNPYLGLVRCDTKCAPANPTQVATHPENGSLQDCMNACTGSFEKAKRAEEGGLEARQGDPDYWFCHGVNFIQGELCEFIGQLGTREFVEGGSDCFYVDGLDS